MKLLVTGGTGFIGAPLCRALAQQGHDVVVLSRLVRPPPGSGPIRLVSWDDPAWTAALREADAVINLAGESIAARRWSPPQKRAIRESRVSTTRRLIEAMAQGATRPRVLVSASAIGYYGPRGDEELDEQAPPGQGFLAETCQAWEAEARRAEPLGVRVVRARIGLVLGPGGGALAKMVPPFRAFVGGPLGHGRQWMSWVHRDDVIGLIAWSLTRADVAGPLNVTAPAPVTMRTFCAALGRALHRPSWAPVPAPVLRLLLGEMAQELLLSGQRVVPRAALHLGYRFHHSELGPALAAALANGADRGYG